MTDIFGGLTKLSEPLSKFIDNISKAIGILYEPTRIKKAAKANADKELIQVQRKIDVFKLKATFLDEISNDPKLKIAFKQFTHQEIQNQQNTNSILDKAIDFLPKTVSSEPADIDWLRFFFEHCKIVSNDEAQILWAKLLADEIASPGSFSKRTLLTLSTLSKKDAAIFNRLCSFIWTDDDNSQNAIGYSHFVIVDQFGDFNLMNFGFNFGELLHLISLGLVVSSEKVTATIPNNSRLKYHSNTYNLVFDAFKGARLVQNYNQDTNGNVISANIPVYVLSDIGSELFRVTSPISNDAYRDFVIKILKNFNFLVNEH